MRENENLTEGRRKRIRKKRQRGERKLENFS